MTRLTLEVSDGLTELSALFAPYEHEARILDPQDARTIRQCIAKLRDAARRQETNLSHLLWNEQALRDQLAGMRVAAEARRPGSNLRLFTPRERPFDDGRGGAA